MNKMYTFIIFKNTSKKSLPLICMQENVLQCTNEAFAADILPGRIGPGEIC